MILFSYSQLASSCDVFIFVEVEVSYQGVHKGAGLYIFKLPSPVVPKISPLGEYSQIAPIPLRRPNTSRNSAVMTAVA